MPMKSGISAVLLFVCSALAAGVAPAHAGDSAAGAKVFRKCKACHDVGESAKSKVGPILNGIVGRPAGTFESFSYSSAMTTAAGNGLVWTEENIAEFLTKPKKFMPGTKMAFAGLRKEKDRANVIAYLATFQSGEEAN